MKLLETTLQLADNKHHLLVDSLNLSSLGQMADIYQMSIVPINPNKKNTDYFEIYFPHIQLSGANLHQAFFNKQLYISDFIVYKPLININKIGKWETNKNIATNYQTDIYNMMSDYIRKLTIRKLTLNSGVLKLLQSNSDKSNFELSNEFSIDMYNFEIDKNSEQRKNKLFFSDNIDLVLKDHSFTLADGVHKIFAKEIGILSSDKKVYMNNANLYPDIQSKNFENMYISIIANIPNVEINQANIFDLFTNGSLSVQNIHVNNPSIKLLFRNENEKEKKSKPKNTKPKMIIENFESIRAKNIIIDNGLLELARSKNKQSVPYANAHIDIMIENVSVTQNEGHFDFNYKNFESKLKDLTFDLPDNIHTVKIGNINYSLQQKELLLQQASIAPSKSYPANEKKLFFDIKIPDIKIGNFDFEEYLNNKTLDIGTLTANKPSVKIEDKRIENTQNKKFSPYKMQLFGTVESFAKHVKAKKININEASFSLNNTKNLSLSNIDIEGTAFRIDKYESSENRLLNCDNVRLSVSDIKKPLGTNGHYTYSIDKMILYSDGRFDIHNANLKPTISRDEYAKIKKYQTDYFTISNAHFSGNDFNLNEFIENQSVIIGNLTADFDRVTIHRNKTYPLHPDQKPPMPQEAIRKAKLKMQIKQASITSNYFEYTELEPEAIDTSMVFFTNLRADISNINNIQVEKNEQMPALIQAMLMGQGKMIINSTWDLHSFDNKFTMNAQCYQIPLKTLNPITEPGLKLSIREGLNQKLEASFTANNDSSVGTMKFAYNDLKVSILNKKNGEVREGKFISFLVNTLALRSDNPRKGRILMPVKFKFYRDKQRSVVGYCWRSVYAGIQATLGIKEKETKPEDEIKKPDNE
jgi:uncharacterized protein YjbI with pentapeptide repeats